MIFTNCRVILADAIRDDLAVVVRDGKIAELRAPTSQSEDTIDLGGNFLAPGFVDVHVHGAIGHDAMEANADAFRAICDYHASGGTTSLLLTTATAPVPEILLGLDAAEGSETGCQSTRGCAKAAEDVVRRDCGGTTRVSRTYQARLLRERRGRHLGRARSQSRRWSGRMNGLPARGEGMYRDK